MSWTIAVSWAQGGVAGVGQAEGVGDAVEEGEERGDVHRLSDLVVGPAGGADAVDIGLMPGSRFSCAIAERVLKLADEYNAGMSENFDPLNNSFAGSPQRFATTRWSIVIAAGQAASPESRRALESLCESYWLPVYAYVRRVVSRVEDAQDLTQAFFAQLLEKDAIAKADPHRGRFRAFLLTALKNFLANERHKDRAEKRGGGKAVLSLDFASGESRVQIEPAHELTPEKLFERRWVLALLDQVLSSLKSELAEAGKESQFEQLKDAIVGEMASPDYERAAAALGITASAAKQAAYRMRKRYRELFRQEVARTVEDDAEVDDEIGRLLETLNG